MSEFVPTQKQRILAGAAPRADGSPEGVNLSQLAEWYRCRYRWHLRHRRQIQRRRIHVPMDRGSLTHAGIAGGIRAYAETKPGPITKTIAKKITMGIASGVDEYVTELCDSRGNDFDPVEGDLLEELIETSRQLAARSLNELDLQRWEILRLKGDPLVEQKLSCGFLPSIPFYGTADMVAKDRGDSKNSVWVADWKVRESLQPVEHEEVDLQLPCYQHILAEHGILTTGSIKFQIRAELPREPELLKSGKALSRARIATTWDLYKATLEKYGFDVAEYEEEMKPKLDVPFFRVDRLYRNQFYLNNVWTKVIMPLGKLWAKSKTHVRHMHFMNCNGCWARDFCMAELHDEDTSFLLQTTYVDGNDPRATLVMRAEDFDFEEV